MEKIPLVKKQIWKKTQNIFRFPRVIHFSLFGVVYGVEAEAVAILKKAQKKQLDPHSIH